MNKIFEDHFNNKLSDGWAWIHEEPKAWKIGHNALHLRTLPGSLWGEINNAHNFLLRPAINLTEGLTIQVNVTNYPQLMGEQAGLIWYHDDDNYIKLVKESLNGEEWIVLAREEAGEPKLINKTTIMGASAEIQFALRETKILGQFRTSAEQDWTEVGECAWIKENKPYIGLFTHGGPKDFERWAVFQGFSIFIPK
jgi:regulation of enolase protein 1 (concanavalin A-like superfamily)